MAGLLLLSLSLLSLVSSAPVPQTNPIAAQPGMDFTYTQPPPASVNAFTFTMAGNDQPTTISPNGNVPLLMDPTATVGAPVDPASSYTAYYTSDVGTVQPIPVQNLDNAVLIQGTTMQSLQDPTQTAVQSNQGTTTMAVPVVLYDAPQGSNGMVAADPAETTTIQPLVQDTTMIQMDQSATTTVAPFLILNATDLSAQPAVAVDLSDPSATSGPAVILADPSDDINPSTPDYSDYDATAPVNAVQQDAPASAQPIVMDDLTPGSTVQPLLNDHSATVVVPVSTTVAPLVPAAADDEVAPLVTVNPVQAQPDGSQATVFPVVLTGAQMVGSSSSTPLLDPNPILADPATAAPVQGQSLTMVDAQQQGDNTAFQAINMTDSLAENLLLNISMPMTSDNLIQRLNSSASTMDYTGKLDVALQLTELAHHLMSAVDDDLTRQ